MHARKYCFPLSAYSLFFLFNLGLCAPKHIWSGRASVFFLFVNLGLPFKYQNQPICWHKNKVLAGLSQKPWSLYTAENFMARPMYKDQDFASILHYWLDIHVLLINFSIPFYLGISLWKSWGTTSAENTKEWTHSDDINCWYWWNVRSENCKR